MRIRSVFLLFSMLVISLTFSQDTGYVTNYLVGETNISIHSQKFNPDHSKVTFINSHDNEQTSVKAAQAYLAACGGTLIHLLNEEERFVSICLMGKTYTFDPNRIYSKAGRTSTLKLLSPQFDDKAQTEVAYLANQILQSHLANSKLIIAIHNNSDSALSVLSYQKEQAIRKHWGGVFVNPQMDPDDFILTTEKDIFKNVKKKNINVIWENTDLIKDDGSLSIYAGIHKIPYINVEAQHDHVEEQLSMLNALDDIIKEYGNKKTIKKSTKRSNLRFK
ncbi:MAG: hypothetical protein JWQ09_2687 [Segetibacter sp.]|nr:hypothetical protein [Segetibacter sp.]